MNTWKIGNVTITRIVELEIAGGSLFSKYIHAYLIIAGISLVIDAVDVIRYLLGDGQLV